MDFFRAGLIVALLYSTQVGAAAESQGLKSGLQVLSNKTDKTVTIEIGDFLPSRYTLAPGQSTIAYVSTDGQTITIRAVK